MEICRSWRAGLKLREIAANFNLSIPRVHLILTENLERFDKVVDAQKAG